MFQFTKFDGSEWNCINDVSYDNSLFDSQSTEHEVWDEATDASAILTTDTAQTLSQR